MSRQAPDTEWELLVADTASGEWATAVLALDSYMRSCVKFDYCEGMNILQGHKLKMYHGQLGHSASVHFLRSCRFGRKLRSADGLPTWKVVVSMGDGPIAAALYLFGSRIAEMTYHSACKIRDLVRSLSSSDEYALDDLVCFMCRSI